MRLAEHARAKQQARLLDLLRRGTVQGLPHLLLKTNEDTIDGGLSRTRPDDG